MPKAPVIQDMLILGKAENLSMEAFLDAPNSLIQASLGRHKTHIYDDNLPS